MKAMVYHAFGPPDVLRCEEIDKPIPGDDEVLIRVRAASANPLDWRMMKGKPLSLRLVFGVRKPKLAVPGRDVAGVIEAAGRNVTQPGPGAEVFGACYGAFAEYARGPVTAIALKPKEVTFEQAASAPIAGLTALQGLRDKGRLTAGQKVLINGAAGGVGSFAVQIAKWIGAEVTGVCGPGNLDRVKSLGALRAIDYTREDFTQTARGYDLLLDCVGNRSMFACRRVLKPGGRCVIVGAPDSRWLAGIMARPLEALLLSPFGSRKFIVFIARLNREDLTLLGELMASGKLTPVIDRSYPLVEAAEALRYLEAKHARGKVVITVSP